LSCEYHATKDLKTGLVSVSYQVTLWHVSD
jgi:hypothetical protein